MACGFKPLSDCENHHRRRARSRSRRVAHAALASKRRRVAVCAGRHGQRHPVWFARTHKDEQLQQGDVGYIPQGFGHSIENLGKGPARLLIGFNTGEYKAIDVSQWIAGNPAEILATNFGKPKELFEKFPKTDVFIARR